MPPKKTGTAAPKKAAGTSSHPSYRDMIIDAILNLKERNGSSRQAIKKYILANNQLNVASSAGFDSLFNRALKSGVEAGVFTQPKGTSGPVKIAKKEPKAAAPKKTETKKTTKTATTKKAAPKKAAAPKKPAAKAKTAAKPKAKKAAAAPAVSEKPTVLSQTKSGRVTKTTAKPAAKKAAPKKAAATKKATPKKKADAPAA